MLNSCWFHADFIFTLIFTMLCATLCITMVLNSCWIHAEFMLNSSWIQAFPWKIYVFYNFSSFLKTYIFHGIAWIQHEFNMNSTPLLCKVLRKALWKLGWKWNQHEISMKSAWIQHEFDMNSTPLLCKVLRKALWKFKVKMKSAWNQHEFSMNSAWIRHEFNTSLILPRVFGDGKL